MCLLQVVKVPFFRIFYAEQILTLKKLQLLTELPVFRIPWLTAVRKIRKISWQIHLSIYQLTDPSIYIY